MHRFDRYCSNVFIVKLLPGATMPSSKDLARLARTFLHPVHVNGRIGHLRRVMVLLINSIILCHKHKVMQANSCD